MTPVAKPITRLLIAAGLLLTLSAHTAERPAATPVKTSRAASAQPPAVTPVKTSNASPAEERLSQDIQFLKRLGAGSTAPGSAAPGSRFPGSPGNLELEEQIAKKFAENKDFKSGAIRFLAPVFVPGKTTVTLPTGDVITIYPMHPTLIRPGNFTEDHFTAPLVDLGDGGYDSVERAKGIDIKNSLALMDFTCGDRWLEMLRFGMRGIVFVAPDPTRGQTYTHLDAITKVYNTEVNTARFFVTAEDGAKLRKAAADRNRANALATINAQPSVIENKALRDPWVLIPGTDPELKKEVVIVTAPIDANCIVPDLAFGGESAGNILLLLRLYDEFKLHPPARSVLLVAINAHSDHYLGERLLSWHLFSGADQVEEIRYMLVRDLKELELYIRKYKLLQLKDPGVPEPECRVWVEVLWNLYNKQAAAAKTVAEEFAKQEREARKERKRQGLPEPPPPPPRPLTPDEIAHGWMLPLDKEPSLDLAPITHDDYLAAIDKAIKDMKDRRSGFFTDSDTVAILDTDIAFAETLKSQPFDTLKQTAAKLDTVFEDERLLESWRIAHDESTGVQLAIKGKLQDEAKRRLNRIKMKLVDTAGRKDLSDDDKARLVAELKQEKEDRTQVLVLFNKIDLGLGRSHLRYREIAAHPAAVPEPGEPQPPSQLEILRQYRDALIEQCTQQRNKLREALALDESNSALADALELNTPRLILSLGLDWTSPQFGFSAAQPLDMTKWGPFVDLLASTAANTNATRQTATSPYVDAFVRTNTGNTDQKEVKINSSFFFDTTLSPSQFLAGSPTAAPFTLKSVFTTDHVVFTPGDTYDQIDTQSTVDAESWLISYLSSLVSNPQLAKTVERRDAMNLWSGRFRTYTLDEFSGKVVPDDPIPNSLIALYQPGKDIPPALIDGDVVNSYRALSGPTGAATLYGISETNLSTIACQLDSRFCALLYDIDKGQIQEAGQMKSDISARSATFAMFPATEYPIYDRIDPTILEDGVSTLIQKYLPNTGSGKSVPTKYGSHGTLTASRALSYMSYGPTCVTMLRKIDGSGGMADTLILITGDPNYRAATNPKPPEDDPDGSGAEGRGYLTPEDLGPDFFYDAAHDMNIMLRHRIDKMQGVSNELISLLLARGEAALQDADKAKAANDHNAFILANYKALGAIAKTYDQVRSMNRDMMKAIILYMALLVPFCFFLEKLLFNFTKLEHSVLAFSLMFSATYAVFRIIHPAFRIALQPEAIFIAFVLGAIGVFVIWVLHKRFETEMQLLFRNSTGFEGDVAYATVGQTAMIIGVSNMKRRRIRTSLTTATIVLVIFTMLSFCSISNSLQPTLIHQQDESPYTGLFYHWKNNTPMDENTVHIFDRLFAHRTQMLVRRIIQRDQPIFVNQPGKDASLYVQAVVGLQHDEDGFLGRLPIVAGRSFSTAPAAAEIILSRNAMEALGLNTEDDVGRAKLRILGRELTLVGIIDDRRYESLRDLDPNFPLLPFKPDKISAFQQTGDLRGAIAEAKDVVFISEELARTLGGKPFSISIRVPDLDAAEHPDKFWEEASLLLDVTKARFHVGSKQAFRPDPESTRTVQPGVYYISSSYRTSVGGLSRLLIPLLIAGSIVLNTMLGTVYERKREIAIYNAIGLNPTHIFLFFLAEAFVYGVIGAVGGYLIGQVLAIIIQQTHLIQGINVNFSSLMVGYAILFTIGLVLLSTIYPGIVATRTAVPSGKRKWAMPKNDGTTMTVVFPFIYHPDLAPGVIHYLYEYFAQFTGESIGEQIATPKEITCTTGPDGHAVYRLRYNLALAPFDLGVTQDIDFVASFDSKMSSYRVTLTITRLSGQDSNWTAVNKPFLEKLRKLLIRWRNIDRTQHSWYVNQGRKLFNLPTGPEPEQEAKKTAPNETGGAS